MDVKLKCLKTYVGNHYHNILLSNQPFSLFIWRLRIVKLHKGWYDKVWPPQNKNICIGDSYAVSVNLRTKIIYNYLNPIQLYLNTTGAAPGEIIFTNIIYSSPSNEIIFHRTCFSFFLAVDSLSTINEWNSHFISYDAWKHCYFLSPVENNMLLCLFVGINWLSLSIYVRCRSQFIVADT